MEGLKECAMQSRKEITSGNRPMAWQHMHACANHWLKGPLYFSTVPAKSLTVVLNAPKGYLKTYRVSDVITKVVVVASTTPQCIPPLIISIRPQNSDIVPYIGGSAVVYQ